MCYVTRTWSTDCTECALPAVSRSPIREKGGVLRQLLRVATVLVFFVFIGTAKAGSNQDLYYVFAGPGSATATFSLSVNPTVTFGNVDGTFRFTVTPIDLMVDGSADPTGDVTFYDVTYGGGLTIDAGDLFDLINPSSSNIALFVSGTEAAPIPTPEPAAVLLIGAGLISVLVKRRLSVSR
jgi:hypothetical protein